MAEGVAYKLLRVENKNRKRKREKKREDTEQLVLDYGEKFKSKLSFINFCQDQLDCETIFNQNCTVRFL